MACRRAPSLTAPGPARVRAATDRGSRAPLVDLVQGRVRLPAPPRLLDALADALTTTVNVVRAAAEVANAAPQMGSAKAQVPPSAACGAFADIVRDDPTMKPGQKAPWLEG